MQYLWFFKVMPRSALGRVPLPPTALQYATSCIHVNLDSSRRERHCSIAPVIPLSLHAKLLIQHSLSRQNAHSDMNPSS